MIEITPIAYVRGGRTALEDDAWATIESRIELTSNFTPDALAGLSDFSHVEVLYHLDQADPRDIHSGTRHPRGNPAWPKVGIFAQRAKNRPNRLGVSIAEILAVEGTALYVRALDAIDGTPVLDLKPVMRGFLPRTPVREPPWCAELMKHYW